MSHEVESMMYAGEVPWHKLGTKVDDVIGTEEAIVKAGLDWPVTTEPVYLDDDGYKGQQCPAMATIRPHPVTGTKQILGVVGPGYKVLQNKDAFKFFDRFLISGDCTLESAGSLRQGKRVWVLAKIKGDPIDVVKGDPIMKYLLLSNSHDGSLAIRVGFTPIRVVCANTLAMAIGTKHESVKGLLRVHHIGDVKATLEDVADVIDLINRQFSATADQFKVLASRPISGEDLKKYVKLIFKTETKEERTKRIVAQLNGAEFEAEENERGEKVLERIEPLFYQGRGNDLPGVKGTWWAAYNAVTEYTTHHRGKSEDGRLESVWMGDGGRINSKALSVAMKMVSGIEAN